jgi:hypothetical protein
MTKLLFETIHIVMPMATWISIELYCHTRDHVIDCCIFVWTVSQSLWNSSALKISHIYYAAHSTQASAKILSYNILTYPITLACRAQSVGWNLKLLIMKALIFLSLSKTIIKLDVIAIATILISVWILTVRPEFQTADILQKLLLGISKLVYRIMLWGIVGVLGYTHDEYNNMLLTANVFHTIVYTSLRTPVTTLFSSSSFLLDVIALQNLQFLLALCGDVHPNPGPCKINKLKANNLKTNTKHSPESINGESAKVLGTSINLINWNARGLGRVKEQKFQNLLGLMNENDIQIAIVSKTRESAGSQNQTQTQANDYTIYKNAYHDIFHTSRYLSPRNMVWGVCLIVKNGLAFSISKIHDLTLEARLVHGTLTIPTKGQAQPMKVDILGVYGPATKDIAVNP